LGRGQIEMSKDDRKKRKGKKNGDQNSQLVERRIYQLRRGQIRGEGHDAGGTDLPTRFVARDTIGKCRGGT